MKLRPIALLCLAAAVFASTLAAQEKTADDVIKVNTTLVSVPVIVCDRQGRYVPDIKQEEFGILQDGKEQKVDFFASVEEPINVALLIDTSSSTREVLGDIKSAAKKLVKLLNTDDKAMVMSFDSELHLLSTLTANKNDLEKAVKKAEIADGGGTILRDAIDEAVRKQFGEITGRKAVILLTDGKDHGSTTSIPRLIHTLEETDVMVYSVYFNTLEFRRRPPVDLGRSGGNWPNGKGGPGREKNPPFPSGRSSGIGRRSERENDNAIEFLNKLSDTTAGRFYDSKKLKFNEAFASIVDELRHQYRLGYYPPDDTDAMAVHPIRIKVMRPDLVVRARTTYRPKSK